MLCRGGAELYELLTQWGNVDEPQSKKQLIAPFPKGDRVPSSASSFCSSLFVLRGKEEVLNLFSLFTAEWDPGCFTLISCAAGGAFLAEPCKKKTSVTEVHVTGEGQGQEVSAPEETARQSLCARAQESTWSQRGEARGEDECGQQRQGGRGEGERRGAEESGGEVRTRGVQIPFRIRSGGSQQSNPITDSGVLCSIR